MRPPMTLMIELSTEEEERLRVEAARAGKAVAEYARRLLSMSVPSRSPAAVATQALLQRWQEDDAADPSLTEEGAQSDLDELKHRLNEPRAASGARLLFP